MMRFCTRHGGVDGHFSVKKTFHLLLAYGRLGVVADQFTEVLDAHLKVEGGWTEMQNGANRDFFQKKNRRSAAGAATVRSPFESV
jgi:hypothetical protein